MVAAEATGIRTRRRIFRHLVPNVMPLLIVTATARLRRDHHHRSDTGFPGLGVKYPLASWGSIINVASDALRDDQLLVYVDPRRIVNLVDRARFQLRR